MSQQPTVLVTGIAGQDGSYLAELLLAKGYEVHGIIRRASTFNTGRLDGIYQDPHEPRPSLLLHYGDLTDSVGLVNLIRDGRARRGLQPGRPEPREGVVRDPRVHRGVDRAGRRPAAGGDPRLRGRDPLLPGVLVGDVRVGAAAAERDDPVPSPQPVRLRQGLRLHWRRSTTGRPTACSPATASCSTTRARGAARPSSPARSPGRWPASRPGSRTGSTSATSTPAATGATPPSTSRRCGGCSSRTSPDDYVIATGESHTVREFCEAAFDHADLDWERHVRVDARYYRPTEVDELLRRRHQGPAAAWAGSPGPASRSWSG